MARRLLYSPSNNLSAVSHELILWQSAPLQFVLQTDGINRLIPVTIPANMIAYDLSRDADGSLVITCIVNGAPHPTVFRSPDLGQSWA